MTLPRLTPTPHTLLADELAAVRGELGRVDTKCETLAGLAGAALAFLVTQTGARTPLAVRLLLGAAGVLLAAAAIVLLVAVLRPRLGTVGFCRWAAMTGDQIRQTFTTGRTPGDRADELLILSRIAKRKNRRVQLAVDLIAIAVALIGAGMVTGVIT